MCGIAGFIGRPKKYRASYELITNLFDHLESRGTHAAGFWATEVSGQPTETNHMKGSVIYHKEPGRSSEFIKGSYWEGLKKRKLDLCLVHARAATKGEGHANNNANNHPFVSSDLRIAMIHNGTLDEASFLKEKYQVLSDTDSEYLLRIYEAGLKREYYTIKGIPDAVAQKVNGIKDIWSYVTTGAMAVAVGERIDDQTRGLFLFRNEKRPLWLADLRKPLGQVFFFSSPDIWFRAVASSDNLKNICWGSHKLIELPPYQVWYMQIDKEDPTITDENLFKLGVSFTNAAKDWDKGEYVSVAEMPKEGEFPVISKIHNEAYKEKFYPPVPAPQAKAFPPCNVIKAPEPVEHRPYDREIERYTAANWEEHFPKCNHDHLCDQIKHLVAEIDTTATNLSLEGSLTPDDYQTLLESLEQHRADLEGTLRMLEPA